MHRCKTQLEITIYTRCWHFQGAAPITGTPAEESEPKFPKHHDSRFPAAEGLHCLRCWRSQGVFWFIILFYFFFKFSTHRNAAGELSSCSSEGGGSQPAEPLLLIHQKAGKERSWVISGSSSPRESWLKRQRSSSQISELPGLYYVNPFPGN